MKRYLLALLSIFIFQSAFAQYEIITTTGQQWESLNISARQLPFIFPTKNGYMGSNEDKFAVKFENSTAEWTKSGARLIDKEEKGLFYHYDIVPSYITSNNQPLNLMKFYDEFGILVETVSVPNNSDFGGTYSPIAEDRDNGLWSFHQFGVTVDQGLLLVLLTDQIT